MFPFGLTIADLSPGVRPVSVSAPRAAAREELRELLVALRLIPDAAAVNDTVVESAARERA